MEDPTEIEKITGALPTAITTTLIAAFSGNPVAALLPVLTQTLASGRHRRRVEETLQAISADLEALGSRLRDISDAQFKLINESILATLQTIDDEKLIYLQRAIRNGAVMCDLSLHEATAISRLVRDLSALEAHFVVEHVDVGRFWLNDVAPVDDKALHIIPQSTQGLVATGLVSLGLLVAAEPTWDETGRLRFAPVVPRLVKVLTE
jgi:hypothetical protein